MKDITQRISPAFLIPPAVLAADNTPAAVSLEGFDAAAILLAIGAGGITFDADNKIEFKLTHCDTEGGTYTAVEQADIVGATVGEGGIVKSLVAAHAAASVSEVGYIGNKLFLKLLADFSGTHGTGTPISALVVRGNPRTGPVA